MTIRTNARTNAISADGSDVSIVGSGGTSFSWPAADGTNGQAIVTDGSGTLSFASAAGDIIVQDEGSPIANTPHTTLNFVGAGVVASDAGSGVATITISGGGGGGSTFADDVFRIQDNGDATKQLAWEVSAITTSTTRTWTAPDSDLDLTPGTGSFATAAEGDLAATALQNVVEDTTPQLGGNLDVNANSIVSDSAGDIAITPDTTGDIVLDGLKWPQADGTSGQVIRTDGAGQLSFVTVGGAQNLWETITSDSGSTVANTATDTLTIAGGTGISTAVSGDTLTITNTGGGPAFADNVFRVQDNADATKQLAFEVSAVESASTVTWTVPIGSLDFAPGTGSFATAAEGDLAATALQDVVDDTTPQLGADLDANSFDILFDTATGIRDESDNEQLIFVTAASAVNHLQLTNSAAGADVLLDTAGGDTDIDLAITPKGAGALVLDSLRWPTADGTSGQAIVTNGSGQLSFTTISGGGGGGSGLTLGTPQASTSGTTRDFTSIPAGTLRIVVTFDQVSTSGTDNYLVQLGDAGGIETTGYTGASSSLTSGVTTGNHTTGFGIRVSSAATTLSGSVILTLLDSSTNTWACSGVTTRSDTAATETTGGSKSLSAELDRIRVTTTGGTDTFDAGKINIAFEGSGAGAGGAGGVGNIVQQVITSTGSVVTGTTTTPFGDTIPTISEGTEFITRTITPTNSNNILLIEAVAHVSSDVSANILTGHLHVDGGSAVAAHGVRGETSNNSQRHKISLLHRQVAGGTSEQTWSLRVGPNSADTIVLNGTASTSTRNLGGVHNSYILITEIDPGNVLTTQTTDATQTTIGSLSVASGTSLSFTIRGHGREDATGDTFGSKILGVIRNQGGETALVGALDIVEFNDAGAATWDITAEANNGTDALDIKVTGEASHTIDWKLTTETIEE